MNQMRKHQRMKIAIPHVGYSSDWHTEELLFSQIYVKKFLETQF